MAWFCELCERLAAQGPNSAARKPDACPWCGSRDVRERRRSPGRRVKQDVLRGAACADCGRADDLTVDHVIPLSAGGTNRRSNLQALCEPCNQAKGGEVR